MKSNFRMLLELKEFKPCNRGFLNATEIKMLRSVLCIGQRTDVELQNLRDFTVLYYGSLSREADSKKAWELSDIMSGICGVIDAEKSRRGMAV